MEPAKDWQDLERFMINGLEFVNTRNAAAYMGVSKIALVIHAAAGRIKADIDLGNRKLYSRATLDAYRPKFRKYTKRNK